ncbi:hypothetical protein GXP67_12570 [Rhodocytophaga rosea]|uniref:HNH domain-containing protein n=1 Tax=Rhodocytophaga rosea TaxID=2704465 RepID=A0A6C0GHC9_9BACT|nr:HNH endonuclease [Rhodocytophaga rosea]QHT67408.1 hypothetical protein GXP67_12570 [Rhodocytophaga rosea]
MNYIQNLWLSTCKLKPYDFYNINPSEFLDFHHITPLSLRKSSVNTITSEKDVVLLCPNCHTAIHKQMSSKRVARINLIDFKKELENKV